MTNIEPIIGKITHIDPKGFGFIISEAVEFTRIFFHWTALKQDTLNFKELSVNMRVRFIPIEIPDRGFRALRVEVIHPLGVKEITSVSLIAAEDS